MKKIYKVISMILMSLLLILGFIGCENQNSNEENTGAENIAGYPLTITDSDGNDIIIENEPKTVISLGPNVTEMIYALGQGEKLVGRTQYCNYPEEASSVKEVGTLTEPNIEAIAEINPDLVVASTHFPEDVGDKLEELGIKTIVLYNEESFEGVYNSIETLGKILNASSEAKEVVEGMKSKVDEVTEKVKGLESPSVYYVVGFGDSDFTAGGDTFIGEMIRMANGENIAEDSDGWGYSKEKIAEKNPNMIIVSKNYDTKAAFVSTDFYKDLDAVKNDKVYEIDDDKLNRQGPRLAEGLEDLAKIIHPEAFK